jgi:hypothetical protein
MDQRRRDRGRRRRAGGNGLTVRELVFALEFRGKAVEVPGTEGRREARTVAESQTLVTLLTSEGVQGRVDRKDEHAGEGAVLEAHVQRCGDGTFVEDGTIRYGRAGAITFETIGRGWVETAPRDGWSAGGVLWRVTAGNGVFAGARGLITSNFTVSADGDVVDDHFARLYLP